MARTQPMELIVRAELPDEPDPESAHSRWVGACPPGEAREETETIGDTSLTQRIDRRPLTGMDLAASMVGMDRAEAGGLLAWPDIVGKMVHVAWLTDPEDTPWAGGPGYSTRVIAVGPLGFLAEWQCPDGGDPVTGLIPWASAVISWEAS